MDYTVIWLLYSAKCQDSLCNLTRFFCSQHIWEDFPNNHRAVNSAVNAQVLLTPSILQHIYTDLNSVKLKVRDRVLQDVVLHLRDHSSSTSTMMRLERSGSKKAKEHVFEQGLVKVENFCVETEEQSQPSTGLGFYLSSRVSLKSLQSQRDCSNGCV